MSEIYKNSSIISELCIHMWGADPRKPETATVWIEMSGNNNSLRIGLTPADTRRLCEQLTTAIDNLYEAHVTPERAE